MNFRFSPEEESFREEVIDFLRPYQNLEGFIQQGEKWTEVKALFCEMAERGWLALAWPEAEGGLGKGIAFEYILWDEFGYARAARNPLAAGIVAKTLIRHGSPQQKERWLPPIRSGELHFSLAYSEPEAGSDLGAVRTRAIREGDEYIIRGEKCWQSYAQDMDCFWLLARTGDLDSRSRGLTLLIVDKESRGLRVEPLPTLDGDQLNAVVFDDVRVPASHRVGPENQAWTIMGEALADERHIQFPTGRLRRDLEDICAWAEARHFTRDSAVRVRLGALAADVREAEMHSLSVLDAMSHGHDAATAAAANKISHTLACQAIARAAMDFGGEYALVEGDRPELLWRLSLWETIGGGTTEVMRSIVARQGLGLGGIR
ncbi:MAG: pilus assembly protein CpaD [bacterium]|nr:pilus assembly protein CpaD [bacterium]